MKTMGKVLKILGLVLYAALIVLDIIFCTKFKAVMWFNCAVVVLAMAMLGYDYYIKHFYKSQNDKKL